MFEPYFFQLTLSVVSVVVFVMVTKATSKIMSTLAAYKEVGQPRLIYIQSFFKGLAFLVLLVIITAIWGVDYQGLFLFASSILAVLGVALFAQWSLLSNITSSVILFFSFPARIGDKIEIIDGAHTITGTIVEISIFQLRLRDDHGHDISYPNNLILQRPVRKLMVDQPPSNNQTQSALKTRLKKRN